MIQGDSVSIKNGKSLRRTETCFDSIYLFEGWVVSLGVLCGDKTDGTNNPQPPLSQELKFSVILNVLLVNRAENKVHGLLHAIS